MTVHLDPAFTVMDLFAGCGGLTQGFHEFRASPTDDRSPFRTVGAVEWDIAAASTYAANFGTEIGDVSRIHCGDIKHWVPDPAMGPVDVILGGPPCQGFSGLGKEDAEDPRNKLWREYMRVVNQLKPQVFIIENVDRFLRSAEFVSLQEATESGELADYQLAPPQILNAADYGVPQARRRAIVLATRRDLVERHPSKRPMSHPKGTHQRIEEGVLFNDRQPWRTIDEIFRRTPYETEKTELPRRFDAPLSQELPGPFRTSELHIGRNPTPRSLERYAAIKPGGNRHDLPPHLSTESWLRHKTGSQDVMGRLHWGRPSVTIRTEFYKPEKGRYLHPEANRPITHYEAALLQGFPEDFQWFGSKVQIARQIGNAVPVGLARALAGAVYDYLTSVEKD